MAKHLVAAVFDRRAWAEEACRRVCADGVAEGDIGLRLLRRRGLPRRSGSAPPAARAISGQVGEAFGWFLRHGEALVVVRAADAAHAATVVSLLRQYAPEAIEIIAPETAVHVPLLTAVAKARRRGRPHPDRRQSVHIRPPLPRHS